MLAAWLPALQARLSPNFLTTMCILGLEANKITFFKSMHLFTFLSFFIHISLQEKHTLFLDVL
jgi:hypothetical protein